MKHATVRGLFFELNHEHAPQTVPSFRAACGEGQVAWDEVLTVGEDVFRLTCWRCFKLLYPVVVRNARARSEKFVEKVTKTLL